MTSYYDAVGLLAICDAIETVEGVPLSSSPSQTLSSRKPSTSTSIPSEESTSQIGHRPSPNSNSQPPNTDPISVADTSTRQPMDIPRDHKNEHDPFSSTPYPYPPFTGKGNSATNSKSRKLSLPLIPYNFVNASGADAAKRSYPMIYAQSLHHPPQDSSPGVINADDPVMNPPTSYSYLSSQITNTPSKQYAVTKSNDVIAQKKKEQRSRKLSTSLAELPSMILDNKMSHMTINTKTPSASPSQLPENNGRPPIMIGGYKVEECHICGRNFKGPKASTHKQQHIRRLHPDDYTPKRGGKKRVVIDAANLPLSQSSPY